MTDITLPIIAAAISLATALGYTVGRNRNSNRARLKKIGRLLGVPRERRESDDDYAARLIEHMQENS